MKLPPHVVDVSHLKAISSSDEDDSIFESQLVRFGADFKRPVLNISVPNTASPSGHDCLNLLNLSNKLFDNEFCQDFHFC